jgi:hypothetical protein
MIIWHLSDIVGAGLTEFYCMWLYPEDESSMFLKNIGTCP